jgi:hypothetical protein
MAKTNFPRSDNEKAADDIDWTSSGHSFKPGSDTARKPPPTLKESAGKGLGGGADPMRGMDNKKKGGAIKKHARGGGIESRGKTRGKMC